MRPWFTFLLVALMGAIDLPMAAAAAPPIDVEGLRPWQGRQVSNLEFEGMPGGLADQARAGLVLAPRRKLLRRKTMRLTAASATADAQRVLLLLARNGFPDARITARGEADGDEQVAVTLVVSAGPAVGYGAVDVAGLPSAAAAQADSVRHRLARGQRFSDAAVAAARDHLMLAQQRAGHARPEVSVDIQRTSDTTATVAFDCRPGARFRYESLSVHGIPDDLVPLVRRTTDLRPATPFTPDVAGRSRRDLRRLQLFRQIRLVSEARSDTTLELVADLKARRMITVEASVGTFTDDPVVGSAGIVHRNLLNGGRGGGLDVLFSTYRREAGGRLWWPALLARRSRSELEVRGEVEDEDSYRLDTVSAELSTLFEPWRTASLRVGLTVSHGTLRQRTLSRDAFMSEVGLLTALGATWYRDTSDSPVDPQRGSRTTVKTEWSPPGAWTDTPFASLHVHGSRYLPLAGGTLALRLDGGLVRPLGEAVDVRPDRRFFAGGVSTMRGYRRRQLGPGDLEGNPIGGEVRMLAGAELRQPLVGPLGTALFVDAGQVWLRRDDLDLADLAVATGVGLLVGTPVGPVRFDLARNLTEPAADQPRWLLSFAIGHPF